jgi:hypothetical protein
MNFKVTNIDWDTDGNKEDFDSLPQEVIVSVDDPDNIADALSDAYGWCVKSFESTPIT